MSCSQGLLVVVPFPLVLVPDEHFHCSEGWVKGLNTAPKYTHISILYRMSKIQNKENMGIIINSIYETIIFCSL